MEVASSSFKIVLVCLGEHKREVKFSVAGTERKQLEEAVCDVFSDVLDQRGTSLLFQVKSEGWAGEYVDLGEGDTVPNGSIIKAVVLEQVYNYPTCMTTYTTSCGVSKEYLKWQTFTVVGGNTCQYLCVAFIPTPLVKVVVSYGQGSLHTKKYLYVVKLLYELQSILASVNLA